MVYSRQRTIGAAGQHASSTTASTLTKKQSTATCPDNQEGLDRLVAHYYQRASGNPRGVQYSQTLLRAIKSFAACTTPVHTHQQAMTVKCVGRHIANIICPDDNDDDQQQLVANNTKQQQQQQQSESGGASVLLPQASACSTETTKAAKKKKQPKTALSTRNPGKKRKQCHHAEDDGENNSINNGFADAAGSSSSSCFQPQKKSAKQLAHENAVRDAMNLATSLPQGGWKVVLLVDTRERRADHVLAKCRMSGIPCEDRTLPIGDMAWIARREVKQHANNGGTTCAPLEVMLGTIVERKTAEDLTSSLFGTRYLEQRLRLQHCGLPQVLLLVEGNVNAVVNCPADTLYMAMMETRIQLDFQIVQTNSLDDTVRFLKRVHRRILQRSFPHVFGSQHYCHPEAATQPPVPPPLNYLPTFASPTAGSNRAAAKSATVVSQHGRQRRPSSLMEMLFDAPPVPSLGSTRFITYQELKCKVERDREAGTRTIGHVHAAMLKQVPSLSQKKTLAVAQAFPTPHALMTAFHHHNTNNNESRENYSLTAARTMLSNIVVDSQTTRSSTIGPKSADEILVAYCTDRRGKLINNTAATSGSSGTGPSTSATSSSASSAALTRTTTTKANARYTAKPAAKAKTKTTPKPTAKTIASINKETTTMKASSSKEASGAQTQLESKTTDSAQLHEKYLLSLTVDDDDDDDDDDDSHTPNNHFSSLSSSTATTRKPLPTSSSSTTEHTIARLESLLASAKDLLSPDSPTTLPAASQHGKKDNKTVDVDDADFEDGCVDLTQGDDHEDGDNDDDDYECQLRLALQASTRESHNTNYSRSVTFSTDLDSTTTSSSSVSGHLPVVRKNQPTIGTVLDNRSSSVSFSQSAEMDDANMMPNYCGLGRSDKDNRRCRQRCLDGSSTTVAAASAITQPVALSCEIIEID